MSPSNDRLASYLDVTIGRFTNYAMPSDDESMHVPWRTSVRALITIPHTTLYFEVGADAGGGLPTYSRYAFGYRMDTAQLLGARARQWF